MSRFWSDIVHKLEPYVPGEQPKVENLIKLNTNENPYGPSPHVLAALQACTNDDLRLYPDPTGQALKDAIAKYYGVSSAQVFVGNGSDEVLAHAFQAFFQQDKPLLYPDISYSFYPVYCGLYRVESVRIPLNDNFEIDVADYDQANGGIIFANPNAPTGCGVTLSAIKALLEKNTDSVVIVDEAYIDFGGETAIGLVDDYPNLLVVQTFSKSRSLAGLRVGFAVGHPDLIDGLVRVKDSFNSYPLDRMALAGAVAAMEDVEYFETSRQKIINSREKMTADMEALGFQVLPSQTNFIFASHPEKDAAGLSLSLREKGVIVRHFKTARINSFLRITVGTNEECQALVKALTEILKA